MRRRLALALVLLALAVIAAVALLSPRGEREDVATPSERAATTGASVTAPHELEAPTSDAKPDLSRITGLVVDESGAPHVDARVLVFALDGRWSQGLRPPELLLRGGPVAGFETHTNAAGAFELLAPVPSGQRLRIEIETADHRGRSVRDLRSAASAGVGVIAAGDNDLGRIVVPVRCAVTGRVFRNDGLPLAGASVVFRAGSEQGDRAACTTGDDGSFVLAAVPSGACVVNAAHDTCTPAEVELTLAAQKLRTNVEIVLVPIAVISGIVLDEAGEPLAGAEVFAEPVERSVAATSDDTSPSFFTQHDGKFRFVLQTPGRHALRAEHPECEDAPIATVFDAGTRDAELRLVHRPLVHVHVVDARTKERIARCGVGYAFVPSAGSGGRSTPRPAMTSQPDKGFAVRLLTPPRIVACAPGYATVEVELGAAPDQIVALTRLGELTGMFPPRADGLRPHEVLIAPPGGPFEALGGVEISLAADEAPDQPVRGSVVPIGMCARRVHVRTDGSFRVLELHPGTYDVLAIVYVLRDSELTPPDATHSRKQQFEEARLVRTNVRVVAGERTDLGALEFDDTGASLHVELRCAPTTEAAHLRSMLRATVNGAPCSLRFDGTRAADFGSLPIGTFELSLPGEHALGKPPRAWRTELAAGKTADLVVDLTDIEPCFIELAASSIPSTAHLAGLTIDGRAGDWQRTRSEGTERRLTWLAFAGQSVVVQARDAKDVVLATSGAFTVPHAARHEVVLRLLDLSPTRTK